MVFGILETRSNLFPPGTVSLETSRAGLDTEESTKQNLVLVPRPSQSPQDPLNWSKLRKELFFLTIVFGATLNGVIGPLLVPAFTIIQASLQIPTLTQVTLLNGSLVMALGISAYLCSCLATVVGKRIIFLVTTIMLIAFSCWGGAAKSYGSLVAARTFQGLSMGAFFGLAGTSSINDVFFVHQRGLRVGLWNAAVIVSVNLAPIISSRVIVQLSWRWAFYILAIGYGVLLGAVLLCMPETTFDRQLLEGEPAVVDCHSRRSSLLNPEKNNSQSAGKDVLSEGTLARDTGVTSPTFWPSFHPCPVEIGTPKDAILSVIVPVKLLAHPVTLWACAMWSVTFSWVIIQGAVAVQIFAFPPYNMTPTAVGNLIGVAPLIGSIIGTFFGGYMCDWIAIFLSRRNCGRYEPEFRLWTIFLTCVVPMAVGGFGLGGAIANGLSPTICGVFLAILNFAVGTGCTGIVAYSNDVFGEKAGEVFGLAMVAKSAFAFGLTFMLNDYYARNGPSLFFFTWSALSVGITLIGTTIVYVYGKRIRAYRGAFLDQAKHPAALERHEIARSMSG